MRRWNVARVIALTLVSGGLWTTPVPGQDTNTPRSVYDRGAPTKSSPSSASAEPRRLPAASRSGERPLAQPRRPRGYLSHGLSDARKSAELQPAGRSPVVRQASPAAGPRPAQGVVPAFFPSPINGAAEPPRAADSQASVSHQIAMQLNSTAPGEHPISPAVRWARLSLQKMDGIHDYSAKMAKRERIGGTLSDYEYMFVKVRHEPFSVYVSFIGPARVKGQEAIYIKGRNDGNLLGHANGMRKIFGTVPLKPDSMMAMAGNRYPITELGIKRLTERLIEVGEHDSQFGECEVKAFPNTKINGRECVCLQVMHPVPRKEFLFNKAKIYVDSQHNLPVRYESYDWPHEPGAEPLLLEEYTYLELKFNNGFTDHDFDVKNAEYQFK